MRFYLIDALRGLAATWVVLFHAYEGGHLNLLSQLLPEVIIFSIFKLGESGVPIFFVISGFVIAHSLAKSNVNGNYIARFALRRSIRLDPPYWASIALVLFLAWMSSQVTGEFFQWPSFGSLLAHLFYLQGILEISHFNIIYWTLCLEIQFYLVFCFLLYSKKYIDPFFNEKYTPLFLFSAAVSLLWPTGIVESNIYSGLFLPHWHAFLLGVFAYWAWQGKIPVHYFYIYNLAIFIFSVIQINLFSLAACTTALLVHEFARRKAIQSMNWKWIQFLGMISYSLYLTHNPVTGASYFVFYKIFGDSGTSQFFAFIFTTAVCIIFAFIFWWLFERWSRELSKKICLPYKEQEKPR